MSAMVCWTRVTCVVGGLNGRKILPIVFMCHLHFLLALDEINIKKYCKWHDMKHKNFLLFLQSVTYMSLQLVAQMTLKYSKWDLIRNLDIRTVAPMLISEHL